MSNNKPMPVPTQISMPFWEGLKARRLLIQQCNACTHWNFYPRRHCPVCLEHDLTWHEVDGAATLYSYTVTRIATLPDFIDEMPQKLAVVELAQGVRINTNLVGLDENEIKIGMALQPVFAEVDGKGNRLLRFTGVGKDVAPLESLPEQAREPQPVASEQPLARQIDLNDEPALQALVSEHYSDWSNMVVVDQALIDAFAQLSGDDYWIHTDPERARLQSPFGGTIAHGALVQVLQSRMKLALGFEISGFSTQINYGSDRLRFPAPVPAGSRIHSRARVKKVERLPRGTQLTLELNTHVVGQDRPSVINDLVILYIA
ncbi:MULTISPECIES: OB-fold domain-containing protein [unclassified Pseudomonas]|uniref:bifunctional OB-fold nucleic acid binding domain-containing protein/MaoC family dehydratase n=1 Tax=unclassified Pseudomonas TaxID=196821 RepID=UPI0012960F41|nr:MULTISPECIES: OB-fold domain-containing protein [unclassified Pseudomonas]MQT42457.1 acyl dehydratase [Pseudomonas sp. FSL R10-0765]MQT50382.1 acyl dehydratase [Pseudomonas sp. FSL R10-2398]MQT99912.1 acyl dehydratase [Pseudomonas sp. FSL R10-2245]MQU13059.1 acyl dehydratase [Pseudomonas sp. FSL R10-2189]MQU37544.1 acyl dehydratase [Pseudomonas sp. FSL R10-2172]